jgi:hypothetical protein
MRSIVCRAYVCRIDKFKALLVRFERRDTSFFGLHCPLRIFVQKSCASILAERKQPPILTSGGPFPTQAGDRVGASYGEPRSPPLALPIPLSYSITQLI